MNLKTLKGGEVKEGKKFDLQDFMNTLNTLDPENIGSWPLAVKIMVYVIVFIVVLVAGYMFDIAPMRANYASGEQAQETLLQDYEQKIFKANNLETYKKQLADMEVSFGSLLRQLPQDTEVPALLEDITHTGLGSGLEFTTIDLGTEQSKEFYAELPINIKVKGDYHAFGAFVSGISALPRIVTLHDMKISPISSKFADNGAPILEMQIQAKTYRYRELTAEDLAKEKKDKNKAKKGKATDDNKKGGA
ncbi:type 4a pilus biogenesis protein PilO [Agitococcus lubricus]|uniref:Type IV pilus assembly protein PilO n=1 Tax=Agitococcus lubricus TaxID=1077255 RepID=A0A2T5J039_9GAMM|nr:type 4a pilus biogenesis protein PilO [Agitococcus lubricus]PTQ89709.1 type IV pilus assembly protein PilO [Agitococcus lubricus]